MKRHRLRETTVRVDRVYQKKLKVDHIPSETISLKHTEDHGYIDMFEIDEKELKRRLKIT